MRTESQKHWGRVPVSRKAKVKERDPMSGMPLDELRAQQAQLRRAFYDRQAKRAA